METASNTSRMTFANGPELAMRAGTDARIPAAASTMASSMIFTLPVKPTGGGEPRHDPRGPGHACSPDQGKLAQGLKRPQDLVPRSRQLAANPAAAIRNTPGRALQSWACARPLAARGCQFRSLL